MLNPRSPVQRYDTLYTGPYKPKACVLMQVLWPVGRYAQTGCRSHRYGATCH